MSIEVTPIGMKCNLSCTYCYEHSVRKAQNKALDYDIDKMIEGLKKEKGSFSIFGGEPLLTDIDTLEKLWEFGFNTYGKNGIQTNGSLITEEHIKLFQKYKVGVGISIDGPGKLNDARRAGTLEETRRHTEKTLVAIDNLCRLGMPPSLIVTLHKLNATEENLPILKSWFKELDEKGITNARLHLLEVETKEVDEALSLTPEQAAKAMLELYELQRELKVLKFDTFKDLQNMLVGKDNCTTCTYQNCDPYTTSAVRGINGHGESINCGRTNKEGICFLKSSTVGYERQVALYHTPQEYGGCKDCRFFIMCKGQCPGTGENFDWRNRTALCPLYFRLFEYFEKRFLNFGVLPLSQSPNLKQIEQVLIDHWGKGHRIGFQDAFRILNI